MNQRYFKLSNLFSLLVLFGITLISGGWTLGQVVELTNPGFENELEGWEPHLHPHVVLSNSADACQGTSSCLVSNRAFSWTGVRQNLVAKLERDQDYRFTLKAKSASANGSILKIQMRQVDDRGTRFVEIGTFKVVPDQWTTFEGGFQLQVNGKLLELDLVIAGGPNNVSDFLVDDVRAARNDWRPLANARIESVRKTDLELTIVDANDQSLPNAEVQLQQIRSAFAFGSALNDEVATNPRYADFFKTHFEWATTEWRVQWHPVEEIRDLEDYILADASVEYCEANAIQIRGHAITWPHINFVPTWLQTLDNVEIRQELDERIANVASRYQGRFASWDVCNESLDHRFYRDKLGEDIIAYMFREARSFDEIVKLFVNETGFVDRSSVAQNDRLTRLVKDLRFRGADVNGIGLQSHFFNDNISPTNIGMVIDDVADLELPIWMSEYDTVNPDPAERAKQLESFYRYVFSRPEVDGIIMWGFWAGAHWRGAEAALVDLDWTINAAGQKYFELIDQWTTSEKGISDENGQLNVSAFQGTYMIQARNPDTDALSQHIVYLPSRPDGKQKTVVKLPEEEGVLTIYGSSDDDHFELEMINPSKLRIGNQLVPMPDGEKFSCLRFQGLQGTDRLVIKGATDPGLGRYFLRVDDISVENGPTTIEFESVEQVQVVSQQENDRMFLFDSPNDDCFVSTHESSLMISPGVRTEAKGFSLVTGRASGGIDSSILLDSPGVDFGFSNLNYTRIQDSESVRRAVGFENNRMQSRYGNDWVNIRCPAGEKKSIRIDAESAEISLPGKTFQFDSFPVTRLFGSSGNSDVLNISKSEFGYLFVRRNLMRFDASSRFRLIASQFNRNNIRGSFSGSDVWRLRDSGQDDFNQAKGEAFCLAGPNSLHLGTGFEVETVGNQSGDSSARVLPASFELLLLGVWELLD